MATSQHTANVQSEHNEAEAWVDPREIIHVGVLMANGRLAPRTFANREEAQAWAHDDEEVVEWNMVCECDR